MLYGRFQRNSIPWSQHGLLMFALLFFITMEYFTALTLLDNTQDDFAAVLATGVVVDVPNVLS